MGGFARPAMPAEVSKVVEQKVEDKFEAVGSIEAIEEVTIVTEIDGLVTDIPFQEGSLIKRGDIIAKIDDSQLAAEVLRTRALFAQSESNYKRTMTIVEQRAGSQQDLDDAAAALKVAEANLKLAEARLNKTIIVAPFDGIIGSRKVSAGAFLRTGDAIAELANLNEIRISFSAPEQYLSLLKQGADVTISSPVYPGTDVKGKIIVIEPVLDTRTRNVQVVARLKNPGLKYRSGMSVNVSAVLNERDNALTIPNESIFASGDQSFVFIVNADSTVTREPVTTGLEMADIVEISQGLQKGMTVVRAGHQKLFDGAKIIPVNSDTKK
jgi:membrane fusion protein (multidrug efflux system)